jgi:hypothetical protein
VSTRADTAEQHLSDGVPSAIDVVEEVSTQIEMLEIPEGARMDPDELGQVLASFESQLMELNQKLRGSASSDVQKLRLECKRTEDEVHGLNSELNVVVKGESG